jgi:hypothetical protein
MLEMGPATIGTIPQKAVGKTKSKFMNELAATANIDKISTGMTRNLKGNEPQFWNTEKKPILYNGFFKERNPANNLAGGSGSFRGQNINTNNNTNTRKSKLISS